MDELWLAQLLNKDVSGDKKLEILKNLDISFTISDKSSAFQGKTTFLGYNCLHIAAIKSDLCLTERLVNLGANVLQQGVQDGKTPLHIAADYAKNYSDTSIWERTGVLHGGSLIDALLSAQIKSNNSVNVKCKNNVSHLHIACMFNHAEAVISFARSKETVNQSISLNSDILPGYTPLHCAIRYSSSESAVILMTLGADIYLENAQGMSSVCYLIERLLNTSDYSNKIDNSHWYPYEKEIERLDSILKVIVLKNKTDDSQLVENTGISAFHLACALKDKWIMQSYITWDFKDINKPVTCKSKLWSGWTPLHFAICCNIQTFEILLKRGADIRMRNAKGETAFDLCLQRYSLEIPLSRLSVDSLLSDEITTLSDLMVFMSNYDTYKQFLQNLDDISIRVTLESPFWPGYNLLHLSILMNHRAKSLYAFYQEIDSCSETDYLVSVPKRRTGHNNYLSWARFESILKKGCNKYAKNADGLTPIHLAFQLDEWHALEELLACVDENIVGPGNLSFLHIACTMGKIDVVERLLDKGADVHSAVTSSFVRYGKPKTYEEMTYKSELRRLLIRKNSTPLHIAVLFGTEKVIEQLLQKHADVHAQDEFGFTPLHLSLRSTKTIAQLLLREATNLKDVRTEDGLSHLHVAAFFDDEKAVKKLLRNGANVNDFIMDTVPESYADFVGKTPLHLAIGREKAARALIEKGANILAENPYKKFETPLDLALRRLNLLDSEFPFDRLKGDEIRIDAMTASGLTILHIACATLDLNWTRKLLERGANPNAKMKNAEGQANTPMHLLIASATSANSIPANLKSFVELLVEFGANVNVNNNCGTPLHLMAMAYFDNRLSHSQNDRTVLLTIADWLLSNQSSYKCNHTDADGFSYFHFACVTNNLPVIKKYLDNGVDINHSTSPFAKNHGGFTPLHFAISHQNGEIVQFLIESDTDVRIQDSNGNTPLHLAIKYFPKFQVFDTLLRRGTNINVKNVKDETPLTCLMSHGNITYDQFQFFVYRGSFPDITKAVYGGQGILGFTMEKTKLSDVRLVFGTFIELTNVQDAINEGFLAIHNVVSVRESQNLKCKHYLEAIQRLTEKGSDIDEQDEKGQRALDVAISFQNDSAVEALLLLGADVNVIEDEKGYSSIIQPSGCPTCGDKLESCMREHLWKMFMVELDLSISIQETIKSRKWEPNVAKLYQSELEKLENVKIFHTLTAKHFLSEWKAVIEYPTMSVAKRQAVNNFFKQPHNLRKEFPHFAGLLAMQYRKALIRVNLLQLAKNILVEAGIDLPNLCLEAILKYLKNSELNFLIKEAD